MRLVNGQKRLAWNTISVRSACALSVKLANPSCTAPTNVNTNIATAAPLTVRAVRVRLRHKLFTIYGMNFHMLTLPVRLTRVGALPVPGVRPYRDEAVAVLSLLI